MGDDVRVPQTVENLLKGPKAVEILRSMGRIKPKGVEDISGDKWQCPRLKGGCS
jgi:hypothetical protein